MNSRLHVAHTCCILLMAYVAVLPSAYGQTCTTQQLQTVAGQAGDLLGESVAVSSHTVIIGAPNTNNSRGSAHVFVRQGELWVERAAIVPAVAQAGDGFGERVAIDRDTVVVGSPMMRGNAGTCYAYERQDDGTWSEQELFPLVAFPNYLRYGKSVAISGDTIVVGADEIVDPGQALVRDVVFVFERDTAVQPFTWVATATIAPSDGIIAFSASPDGFGFSVDVDERGAGLDPVIVVGANTQNASTGSAYFFERQGGTWNEISKVTSSTPGFFLMFGYAVSISGTTAVVSQPLGTTGQVDVFVDTGSGWSYVTRIDDPDGVGDIFGKSVDLEPGWLAIGASGDDTTGVNAGAMHIFQEQSLGNWAELSKELPAFVGDGFGSSVSISGTTVASGTGFADTIGVDSGSVWMTMLPGEPCPTFTVNRATLSASQGNAATFTLITNNPAYIGNPFVYYWIVGSSSGTTPGMVVQGFDIPLNNDSYTGFTLQSPFQLPVSNFVGQFDASGQASAQLILSPASSTSLVGSTLEHVFAIFDLGSGQIFEISNLAGSIDVVP